MARSRNIKPGFFKNEALGECSPLARLLFAGLWCLADREGRLEDRPKRIRAELLPYDDGNVDELLGELHETGFILRYAAAGGRFIQIVNFSKHQNPHHKEPDSTIPAPGKPETSLGPVPDKPETSPGPARDEPDASPGPAVLIPDSPNLIPDLLIPGSAADAAVVAGKPADACPYQLIVESYHEHFPSGPRVTILNDKRKRAIAARWREVVSGKYRKPGEEQRKRSREEALRFFGRYFGYCEDLDWCTGRSPMKDGRHFRATIDNLMGIDFMAKRSDVAHDLRDCEVAA